MRQATWAKWVQAQRTHSSGTLDFSRPGFGVHVALVVDIINEHQASGAGVGGDGNFAGKEIDSLVWAMRSIKSTAPRRS